MRNVADEVDLPPLGIGRPQIAVGEQHELHLGTRRRRRCAGRRETQPSCTPDVRLEAPGSEQLEAGRRSRVDLEHPGTATVPNRVDTEGTAHAEPRRDLVAYRAQLILKPRQLRIGQTRRCEVAHPAKTRPTMQLLGEPDRRGAPAVADRHHRAGQTAHAALQDLGRALCHERHVVTLALTRAAGTTGAQDALAWQTGFGGDVDLVSGHPELLTATRPVGEDEGVDVVLRVESGPGRLATGVAQIALGSRPVDPNVEVSIRTAAAGVEAGGTVHRLDGVPLRLQAPRGGDAPTAAALLTRLLAEVRR